jgi:hypothetical protein
MAPCPSPRALRHLLVRLRPLQRALHVAADLREAATDRICQAGAIPEAITRGHVGAILEDLDHLTDHRALSAGPATLSDDELAAERALRDDAATAGARLPLDGLGDDLGLDARVLDLAHYFRAVPRVMDDWGFSRRVTDANAIIPVEEVARRMLANGYRGGEFLLVTCSGNFNVASGPAKRLVQHLAAQGLPEVRAWAAGATTYFARHGQGAFSAARIVNNFGVPAALPANGFPAVVGEFAGWQLVVP